MIAGLWEIAKMKQVIAATLLFFASLGTAFAQDPGWPRQITKPQGTIVYYQPQVDNWNDFENIDWRMAISITPTGGKATVGALLMHGWTSVNSETQMVLISNMTIKNAYFPSLDPGSAAQMQQLVTSFIPPSVWISMHRLVACVPKPATTPTGVQLNNDPPQIFVSYQPAILLGVEGQPQLADIPNTKLKYVFNTNWALFQDKEGAYYLLVGNRWLRSFSLQGPWTTTVKLPHDMDTVVRDPQWVSLKGFVPPPASSDGSVPTVFYSTSPSVVILFDGQPVYSPIPGTQLSYAVNTNSYVFVYSPTNQFYYMTAGRWFSSSSLQGPWTFANSNLPADFAHIPPSSGAGQVLASVPGTEEAKDAVMIAQVPTSITVNASAAAAKASVTYDGAPQFVPISGTSMSYATNTAQKVIQVGDLYYLCLQGIWFMSTSPQGPWQTAQTVPQVIYTIPPSSPVYNVTYVTQVYSDGNVQASYTAGYMGAFIVGAAVGAVVAGGTGYYYPPYYYHPAYGYPYYHPYPTTYGYSSTYHSTTGAYGVSQTAYGAYGGSATRSASYNPYTGTSTHTASANTAYGHASAGTAYNPYTGASAATKQGSNGYSSWGSSAAVGKNGESAYSQHYSTAQGTTGSVQTSAGGKAVGASGAYGNSATAAKGANGNMYASADGNVYKNTGSGWQKAGSNGSWNSVNSSEQHPSSSSASSYDQHPSSSSASSYHPSSSETQSMQQEADNRQRGEQSAQNYSQQRSSGGWGHGGSSGGGGWGGGGGGRRR
jgi:hypothetical protein